MTSLTLKRAKLSRSSGQWQDEDYDVLADGKVVGRLYEDASASTPPELRWFWSITVIVPSIPNVTSRPRMFDPVLIKTARPFVNCPGPTSNYGGASGSFGNAQRVNGTGIAPAIHPKGHPARLPGGLSFPCGTELEKSKITQAPSTAAARTN